jgi:hypothetical protein
MEMGRGPARNPSAGMIQIRFSGLGVGPLSPALQQSTPLRAVMKLEHCCRAFKMPVLQVCHVKIRHLDEW